MEINTTAILDWLKMFCCKLLSRKDRIFQTSLSKEEAEVGHIQVVEHRSVLYTHGFATRAIYVILNENNRLTDKHAQS